ncbi:Potassium uptake protein [uncultured Desulfobacterium sp.]|uniref:Potassium uptake protein n=1 Tax=uncultured Desulfobacterium sp. TaxID=201089 RepID=A0A445N239_9BACT|nr:Potassium uptake protein [uncultured Desulfobacterium sp.]
MKQFLSKNLTPPRIFILSFAVVIFAGATLLWLPFSASNRTISFIDALFTSTSAVCVTGLSVLDLSKQLSISGQVVTLFLFQIGGLGIISFSVLLFEIMGRQVSFRERDIVQSTFLASPSSDFGLILKWVFLLSFTIEFFGAVLLFIRFSFDFPLLKALYYAIYHSVSAFNNCGYSLFSNSLVDYQGDLITNATIMVLIVLGGLGFVVQREIILKLRGRIKRLSLHTKIVLITTAILIVSGAVFFYVFESENCLSGISTMDTILVSLFQSITPRTCGFNTVDIGALTNATILLMLVLMFIGASPGSTGGGIKTTSFALSFIMIINRFKGREDVVNVFNRSIPQEIITRTLSIIFASCISVFIITAVVLLAGEADHAPLQNRHLFIEYLFETVSAFGTVGLSMGVSSSLNDIQKLAIMIMMFAGRVGPLTLAFSLSFSKKGRELVYAEETVMVG